MLNDEKKYYEVIWSEDELKKFYDTVLARKPLLRNEVRYVSLSVRNKYLTEDERKHYQCGRSEMFGKQVVRHDEWSAFLQAVRRYECNVEGYLTKSKVPYPPHAMVCYVNINPCDALKTLNEMNASIDEHKDALVYAAIRNSKVGIDEAFYKLRKVEDTMISLYARNFGTKTWIDFDFDVDPEHALSVASLMDAFLDKTSNPVRVWVKTKGGVHLLFLAENLKFDPFLICHAGYIATWATLTGTPFTESRKDEIVKLASELEIVMNGNAMTPCPGTIQAGHKVRIVEKPELPAVLACQEGTVSEMVRLFKEKKTFFRRPAKKGPKGEKGKAKSNDDLDS